LCGLGQSKKSSFWIGYVYLCRRDGLFGPWPAFSAGFSAAAYPEYASPQNPCAATDNKRIGHWSVVIGGGKYRAPRCHARAGGHPGSSVASPALAAWIPRSSWRMTGKGGWPFHVRCFCRHRNRLFRIPENLRLRPRQPLRFAPQGLSH